MFATGPRAHQTWCGVFFFVFLVGGQWVTGRPQAQSSHGKGREGHGSPQSALKFSPELLLESSLESAVSPISLRPRPLSSALSSTNHVSPGSQAKVGDRSGIAHDRLQDFTKDLDGSEEKWEQDPDIVDSQVPPPQRWTEKTPDLPVNKVAVSPVVEDDINVDRFHGSLLGFNEDDGNEDLDLPELRLKGRDSDSGRAVSARAGYVHGPRNVLPHGVPSSELIARDVDVDGPPLPNKHVSMPNDVPADPDHVVPWQQVVQKDLDIDRPNHPEPPLPPPQPEPYMPHTSLDQWKRLALGDLTGEHDASHKRDSTDMDAVGRKDPFQDIEEEDEVPEELVRQVIKAMEAPSSWRYQAPSVAQEDGGLWEEDEAEDEEDDQYEDWVLQEGQSPQESRLITLIFRAIDGSDGMAEDSDEDAEEATSADDYERELSIWQILTNFPFPMLLGHDDMVQSVDIDYMYDDYNDDDDDDDDYDDYSPEYYEDEDFDDDDDEDDEAGNDNDKLDDYFYSEEDDDCDDCSEDVGNTKQEITVLSLPPILAK